MREPSSSLIAITTDLFLQSRIRELADLNKTKALFATDSNDLAGKLTPDTKLVILDLSATDYDPFLIVRTLKESRASPPILGFFPHVKHELKTKAEETGVDFVVPNSKLMETIREILREAQQRG